MGLFHIGQVVQMKKGHPCGANCWQIIRTGMDYRIKCLHCGRSVLLPRARFERRVKNVLADSASEMESEP